MKPSEGMKMFEDAVDGVKKVGKVASDRLDVIIEKAKPVATEAKVLFDELIKDIPTTLRSSGKGPNKSNGPKQGTENSKVRCLKNDIFLLTHKTQLRKRIVIVDSIEEDSLLTSKYTGRIFNLANWNMSYLGNIDE